jgi:hypothetical protein
MTMKPIALATAMLLALLASAPAAAQLPAAKAKTGTEFYTAYLDAFAKATTIDDLSPWLAKEQREQIAATPADQRKMMFGMIKEMSSDNTDVTVLKETPTAIGADLDVQAVSKASKGKVNGKITLVKEGGEWKVAKEAWKM